MSRKLLCLTVVMFTGTAWGSVAVNFVPLDNTSAPELAGFVTQDIRVLTTNDWSSSAMLLNLTSGSIYQDVFGDPNGQPPDPKFFPFVPSLAFDTFVGLAHKDPSDIPVADGDSADGDSTDFIAGTAGDVGGSTFRFDTQVLDVTWANIPSGFNNSGTEFGISTIGRLSLSGDAQGTLGFSISEANKQLAVYEFPIVDGRVVVPLDPPPDPGGDCCFGGIPVGILALNSILGNWNANVVAGDTEGGDYNHDGFVGIEDLNAILSFWGIATLQETADLVLVNPVDVDGDGFVGLPELNHVLGNWNAGTPPGAAAVPLGGTLGDFNGDGFIGQDDLNAVLSNWNTGTPPGVAVPEPGSIAFLAGAWVILTGRFGPRRTRSA